MPGRIAQPLQSTMALDGGRIIRSARVAIGWSQRELSRRSGISQTAISRFERGKPSGLELADIEHLAACLGGTLSLTLSAPYLADRARQRDVVHARCIAHVALRLRGHGWTVETEVEIDGSRGPGWIDVLAFHAGSRTLLVIEVKTELHDLGRVQRTLSWYSSRASSAAHRRGWRVRRSQAALLLLASEAVDDRLRDNRALVGEAFPGRATELRALVSEPAAFAGGDRPSLGLIDPFSRRREWIRPARIDGRRTRAPYADYASIARRITARPPREAR